jgi:predicted nucleic-acid-binding Zn-ribbon protein
MSKLIRRTNDEIEKIETRETETLQDEELVIRTSEGKQIMDTGKINLECSRCHDILSLTRNEFTNIMCPKCGGDKFYSHSEFLMEMPGVEKLVKIGDWVERGNSPVWKIS